MTNLALTPELRDGNTIRAYLDELVRLKTPVQLWITHSDSLPFETTLVRVARDTFTTLQTPPLPVRQNLDISFMVDARRFTAHTQVVSTGVFSIPGTIAAGERRARFRAPFSRSDGIEVFACETVSSPFVWGRVIAGRLLDLSLQGLRMALEDVTSLTPGQSTGLKRGDRFDMVCITGLPYTPTLQCGGIIAHVPVSEEGAAAGFMLTGLMESDQKNIERILARRFPTTFGAAFPKKNRKTDIADQAGLPVLTQVALKAPEVVAAPAPPPPPRPTPSRPHLTAVMRIRKASRKVLVISAGNDPGKSLAAQMREDDFKQVFEATSYLEAQNLARGARFDMVLLDIKVGGHQGQMILESLRRHDLLVDTPVILIADRRDASVEAVAEAIDAVHIHEKRSPYETLLPALYSLLA
jgi:CheY-like chemotaxis protein